MKRSDFFIRLTTGVLFLAVACYIGVYLYIYLANTYETTLAISYAIEETLPAQGYIVRTESVIEDVGTSVLPIVAEGEKVAAGQAIAVEFLTPDALEVAGEIRYLTMRIAQMEANRGANDASGYDTVLELSSAVHTNDLRRLDEISLTIETGIFSMEEDISVLRARLAELERRSAGTRTITAHLSGTFSHTVDGFEHIGPDVVYQLLPSDLEAHFRTPYGSQGAGKLITEFKWYYTAIMNHEDAIQISVGQIMTVQFLGAYQADVPMLVERIGRREDGNCVVLFSSDRGIHDVAPLRFLRADIVLNVVTGIRVPKGAIHLDDDGTTFIYLQTSGYAERVNVEILKITEDNYLVRDGSEMNTPLRVDSVIIVKANNLYHGKVVG
jgi:hypothetical protein